MWKLEYFPDPTNRIVDSFTLYMNDRGRGCKGRSPKMTRAVTARAAAITLHIPLAETHITLSDIHEVRVVYIRYFTPDSITRNCDFGENS